MKKIGLLTFQNADNYGAMCQMAALLKVLKSKNGGNAEVINVYDKKIEERYKLLNFGGGIKSTLKQVLFLKNTIDTKKKFELFRRRFFSDKKVTKEELCKLKYDAVIVGSDQVWNITLTGEESVYFLDWFSGDKYSYAASFGVTEFDERFDNKFDSLKKYVSISVREKNAMDYLSQNGIKAQYNIDPIFLLDREMWKQYAVLPSDDNYILIYTIGYSDDLVEFARRLSKIKNNLPVYYISNDIFNKSDIKILRGVGPEEWIGYFLNAQYVITNSFHGASFAIKFNKNFYYDNIMTKLKDTNARMTNLLSMFNITGRNIKDSKFDKLDWAEINNIIDREKQRSMEYIDTLLKD